MVDVDQSPAGTRAIAREGYSFLFPLVANYGLMYAEAVDSSSPVFGGGFGRWTHRRHTVSQESDVSTRHATTLDSSAWLDVRTGPWMLSIPAGGCERTTTVTDLWGFVVDEVATQGSAPTPVVVADEAWVGSFVRCETWALIPEADEPAIREIQTSCRLRPLSGWSGGPPTPPTPPIDWWPVDSGTLTSMGFWSAATFALTLTMPSADDREILDRLAEIGVAPDVRWDEGDLPPEVLAAIGDGMDEALTELMRAVSPTGDHTPTTRSRSNTGRDHVARALAALRRFPLVGPSTRTGSSA